MLTAVDDFGRPLNGYFSEWEASAVRAMQAEPEYFARWYTVKSLALVGVSVALAVALFRKRSR